MHADLMQFRDALRAVAPTEGVSFVDYSKCRCWAEPLAWGGPNLSADGSAEMDDEEDEYPERERWTMFGDVAFDGRTIGLLLTTGNGYIAVELSSAQSSQKDASRRAWLAHHRIELVIIDAELNSADSRRAAQEFCERAHDRVSRARAY